MNQNHIHDERCDIVVSHSVRSDEVKVPDEEITPLGNE